MGFKFNNGKLEQDKMRIDLTLNPRLSNDGMKQPFILWFMKSKEKFLFFILKLLFLFGNYYKRCFACHYPNLEFIVILFTKISNQKCHKNRSTIRSITSVYACMDHILAYIEFNWQ